MVEAEPPPSPKAATPPPVGEDGESVIRLQPLNPKYAARVLPREEVAGLYAAVSVTREIRSQDSGVRG